MRMFYPPGGHLVEQPEAVDAQRDDSEEPPKAITAASMILFSFIEFPYIP